MINLCFKPQFVIMYCSSNRKYDIQVDISGRQPDIYVWFWGRGPGWGYRFGLISILMILKTRELMTSLEESVQTQKGRKGRGGELRGGERRGGEGRGKLRD